MVISMNKAINDIMYKASNSFQMIREINLAIEQLCNETKAMDEMTITIEDECLNVNIKVGENTAYTQISLAELYAKVMKCNSVNCYEKIVELIGEGINENIMENAIYVK